MDQHSAPILDALAIVERHRIRGFGAPGHGQGRAIPSGLRELLGRKVFAADVNSPKGLDDRTESDHVIQRAHEIAAEAWQTDFCRFVTGGTTQALHTALAAVAQPGDTVIFAANVHKAERAHALASGLVSPIVPVIIDAEWDLEHGVDPAMLEATLTGHPEAKAVVIVSPTYYGVTSDIAALSALCHARSIPLICDAAWGGAFAFCEALPHDPLTKGADIAVYSLHKTMGALSQGSVLVAKGGTVDLQRLWLAYEIFETTSPSIPIMASLDATRRDHALDGERIWRGVLKRSTDLRARLSKIAGLRILGPSDAPANAQIDETTIVIDVSALGVTGYAIDDWLNAEHRISIGLSDARHLVAVISAGTTIGDIKALARALAACARKLRDGSLVLGTLGNPPTIDTLSIDMAMEPRAAFFGETEPVALTEATGRISAEIIAPAPPGVPRLVPGQRITKAHVQWLLANRNRGAFFLDPTDPGQRMIRVVA